MGVSKERFWRRAFWGGVGISFPCLGLAFLLPTVKEDALLHWMLVTLGATAFLVAAYSFVMWLSSPADAADTPSPISTRESAEQPKGAAAEAKTHSIDDVPGPHSPAALPPGWESNTGIWRGQWIEWRTRLKDYGWVLNVEPAITDDHVKVGRAFPAMRRGIALMADPRAMESQLLDAEPAPGELYGGLEKGVADVLGREEHQERIRGLVREALRPVEEQKANVEAARGAARLLLQSASGLATTLGEPGGSGGLAGRVASLQAGAEERSRRISRLEGSDCDNPLQAIADGLPAIVDALEAVAYRVSIRDFHHRHGSFVDLRRALAAEVLPLLEAAPEDEAARHYHRALSELIEQLDTRLARATEDVLHPGRSLAGVEDLDVRIERLRARADRLKEGDPEYLREQAKPSVQEHLRPLVDMLVRDFLGPLLQEAAPVAGDTGVSDRRKLLGEVVAAARKVLAETIELRLIEPVEGGAILDAEHEEVDVLSPGEGAKADTVASVVEPGYRWAGELIARARVRSYR